MSPALALVIGATLGMAAGALLIPFTRRELAASLARAAGPAGPAGASDAGASPVARPDTEAIDAPHIGRRQWLAIAAVSGVLPALILSRVGWSPMALPPLLMLVGLVQLAYCDLTRRLLPKTMVWALGAVVAGAGVFAAATTDQWWRFTHATVDGLVLFALCFLINLMNPRWIAFGDVRLSLVVGFGLGFVSRLAVVDCFFYANIMAAVVGLVLIWTGRAKRGSPLPFGLYLTLAAALVLVLWS
jgi:leader peptidase (prepilin peptidase) / N-methyltransferase